MSVTEQATVKFPPAALSANASTIVTLQESGNWDTLRPMFEKQWGAAMLQASIDYMPTYKEKVARQAKIDAFTSNIDAFKVEVMPVLRKRETLKSKMAPFTGRIAPLEQKIAELRKQIDDIKGEMKPLHDQDMELAKQQDVIQAKWGGTAKLENGSFKATAFTSDSNGKGHGGGGQGGGKRKVHIPSISKTFDSVKTACETLGVAPIWISKETGEKKYKLEGLQKQYPDAAFTD